MARDPRYPTRFYRKHGAFYFVDAQNKWHHLGREYMQALAKYAELNIAPPATGTMGDLIDRYEREVLPTKAPETQRGNRASLKQLRPVFEAMRPIDIKPQHIYEYMDRRGAPVRANREKALLSHIFKYAIRWGVLTDNPCRFVMSNKEAPRDRYVTDEEFWQVYDAASAPIQRAMLVAVVTGLRLADVLSLSEQNVREDGLLVQPAKTRRSTAKFLLFPWTPGLFRALGVADLDEALRHQGPFVPNSKGEFYKRTGFQAVWQLLMRSLFPDGVGRFTFHDLRAKAGSDSIDGKLLGHTSGRVLHRHYRRKPEVVHPIEVKR